MKILVAIDNEIIMDELKNRYKERVYEHDIVYMEGVIEFLSRTTEKYIVITKDTLNGNLTNMLYAKQIKVANKDTKVIYIVTKLDDSYKEFLFANEIFNILEGDYIIIDDIVNLIENDKNIVYKTLPSNEITKISEPAINYYTLPNVIPKQIISIFGTSGSGKSFVSSTISKEISKMLDIKVALIDMDILNPSIDILNNIEANTNVLSQIVDDLDKKININSRIESYMIQDKNDKNISYLTNNVTIFECQNKLSEKYYEKIYKSVELKYDYTIIDLPSSPFLDVVPYTLELSTKILFVLNPNYSSIRQANKYLDVLTKLWNVPKENIYIIINKQKKDSLDNIQIKSMLSDFQIVLNIEYDQDIESYINGSKANIDTNLDLTKLLEVLGIRDLKRKKRNFKFVRLLKGRAGDAKW